MKGYKYTFFGVWGRATHSKAPVVLWLDDQTRFQKLGKLKLILSKAGGSFLVILQENSVYFSSTTEAGLDAKAVHENSYTVDLTWGKLVRRRSGVLIARVRVLSGSYM